VELRKVYAKKNHAAAEFTGWLSVSPRYSSSPTIGTAVADTPKWQEKDNFWLEPRVKPRGDLFSFDQTIKN
jgi:hypothetical protein